MRHFLPVLVVASVAPLACFRNLTSLACDGRDPPCTTATSEPASSSSESSTAPQPDPGSSSATTTTSSGSADASDTTTGSDTRTTTSDTTAEPTGFCGDGIVQPEFPLLEECDDFLADTSGCNLSCQRDRVVFIASLPAWTAGDLQGLEGADNYCRSRAGMAGLPQFIKFKAFLSDSQHDVGTRLFNGKGRYVLLDGTVVADDWVSLLTEPLQHPINLTEKGEVLINGVWTGTDYGTGKLVPGADNCADWTSNDPFNKFAYYGASSEVDANWVSVVDSTNPTSCAPGLSIYCIEQK
jgi:cysteine-rich repeat protein